MNLNLVSTTFSNLDATIIFSQPSYGDLDAPMITTIDNCTFTKNDGGLKGIISVRQNSKMIITKSRFIENMSLGRASCLEMQLNPARMFIYDSVFERNYAY